MKTPVIALLILLLWAPVVKLAPVPSPVWENTFAKDFLMDAPWRVRDAATAIPFVLILKDCGSDHVNQLHWARLEDVTGGGQVTLWEHDFGDMEVGDDPGEADFRVWLTTVCENHPQLADGRPLRPAALGYGPGDVIQLRATVSFRDNFLDHTETRNLRVAVGRAPFPWPAGWFGGDTHVHTMFTNNVYEWGSPLPVTAAMAGAVGLDWLTATDHSCDLDETVDGPYSFAPGPWLLTVQDTVGQTTTLHDPVTAGGSWPALGAQVAALDGPSLRLLRAVELNLASVVDAKTLHGLVYNPTYLSSPRSGAPGERPVTPDLVSGLMALDPTGFAFAAHPVDDMSAEVLGLDFGINGASWSVPDLAAALDFSGFRGLQVFNTRRTGRSGDTHNPWPDFDAGRTADTPYPERLLAGVDLWDDLLLAGLDPDPPRKVFVCGGSDAHGDFNYATHLGVDDYADDNALGKVQTVVRVDGPYSRESLPPMADILAAFAQGRSIITDGPFLTCEVDGLKPGETGRIAPAGPGVLKLVWASSPEFGPVVSLKVWALARAGGRTLLLDHDPRSQGQEFSGAAAWPGGDLPWPAPDPGWVVVRAELLTDDGLSGYRAYTNPVWLQSDPASEEADPDGPGRTGFLDIRPNPGQAVMRIGFELEKSAPVTLRIVTVTGGAVCGLLQETFLPPGRHFIRWDGRDGGGCPVASGLYIVLLNTPYYAGSRKLCVLR